MNNKPIGTCDTCYANRKGRFNLYYDHMMMCWVCKLRLYFPMWAQPWIDKLDRSGSTDPDA